MMRKFAMAGAVMLMFLGACGPVPESAEYVDGGNDSEVTFELKDGRTVLCIAYNRGLSCDWAGATSE